MQSPGLSGRIPDIELIRRDRISQSSYNLLPLPAVTFNAVYEGDHTSERRRIARFVLTYVNRDSMDLILGKDPQCFSPNFQKFCPNFYLRLIITCNIEISEPTMLLTRLMRLVNSHPLLTHVGQDSMGRVSNQDAL